MNKNSFFLLIYILIGIANSVLYTLYLGTTGLPGGNIGMMPILIILVCLITVGASIAIVLLLKFFKLKINYTKAIIIFHIIYTVLIGRTGFVALFGDLSDPYIQLEIWLTGIMLVIFLLSLFIAIRLDNRVNKVIEIERSSI